MDEFTGPGYTRVGTPSQVALHVAQREEALHLFGALSVEWLRIVRVAVMRVGRICPRRRNVVRIGISNPAAVRSHPT